MPHYNLSYNLTAADIATLTTPSAELQFSGLGNNAAPEASAPGNFGWIDADNTAETNPNQMVANALLGCTSGNMGVGTDAIGITGQRNSAAIGSAIDFLCGAELRGNSVNCDLSRPPVLVAIYDSGTGTGSNATFHIKYIGAFKFTRQTNQNDLWGYLTTTDAAPNGEVSPVPGPVTIKPQLVK